MQPHLFVAGDHNCQRSFNGRRPRIISDDFLRAVGRCNVRSPPEIIFGDSRFVRCQGVYEIGHARPRISCILTFWVLRDEQFERFVGFFGRDRVALGRILPVNRTQQAEVFNEIDSSLQVKDVIGIQMIRMLTQEPIARRQSGCCIIIFPVSVRNVDFALLSEPSIRITRIELLVVLDGFLISLVLHSISRGIIEPICRPVTSRIRRV